MSQEAKINAPDQAYHFVMAGNAVFTLRSCKTGVRYTYKVRQADETPGRPPVWFVNLLTGPDNTGDYTYMGLLNETGQFRLTAKSKLQPDSAPVKAFVWTLGHLQANDLPADSVEFWHAGRCGRCGRVLTVPESVESGYGPECIQKI